MNTTDKILEELDVLIEDSLRNSKPIGAIFCDARRTIANYRARIAEFWDALETVRGQRDEARGQLSAAKREAEYLATSIHRAEYSNVAPNWGLCDSVAGVISQIDNMYAGVRAQRDELRRWTSVNGVIDLERERDRGLKENRDLWSSNAELAEQRDRLAEALREVREMCLDKTIELHPDHDLKGTIDKCIDISNAAIQSLTPTQNYEHIRTED